MPHEGRETFRVLERIATAIEKLAEDPVLEIESGPPICPHCETVNPDVSISEVEEEGPLIEYLLIPTCSNCGKKFYAVPLEWAMFATPEEAENEIHDRTGMLNVSP
jgi:uncharacterized protein with PIN domain